MASATPPSCSELHVLVGKASCERGVHLRDRDTERWASAGEVTSDVLDGDGAVGEEFRRLDSAMSQPSLAVRRNCCRIAELEHVAGRGPWSPTQP